MQLTDNIIHDSYLQLGLDDKYFPIYEEEVKRCYAELQDGCPDDEDTSDDDSNVMGSIQLSNQYIECYAGEIEKGHGEKWASVFTRNFVIGEKDDIVVYEALKAVEDKAEKEKELDIHAKSLNEDPIFQQRYKTLVKELDGNSEEMAKNIHWRIITVSRKERVMCMPMLTLLSPPSIMSIFVRFMLVRMN